MTTHAVTRRPKSRRLAPSPGLVHTFWLAGGLLLAFLVPFVLADSLGLDRDLYYGLYGAMVIAYVSAWAWSTGQSLRRRSATRLGLTILLAAVASAVLIVVVYKTEDATPRPSGLEMIAAIAWRGVFYGAVDGVLLSAFPILAVFAAFAGSRLRSRRTGIALVGLIALVASLAMSAVYHVGYSDFRNEKLRKPVVGDVIWSAPTLLTLNPVGAPLTHVAMHTSAALHSYETDTFLPPHEDK